VAMAFKENQMTGQSKDKIVIISREENSCREIIGFRT
jgi:hypothetical protein